MVKMGKSRTAWLTATFFGVGFLKPGPGTWASAITVLLWWGASRLLDPLWLWPSALGLCVLVTAIGIPTSTIVARESSVHDPGFVVIDEVAGQMIPLIASPLGWKYMLASLVLFRVFDIWKPPPLKLLEKLPAGTGIMIDDLGAGVYAWVLLRIAIAFGF